ncbi:MAG TPA: 5'-3' exonuclease H3TH domain-containing protein [Pengzhenrongella sp.]
MGASGLLLLDTASLYYRAFFGIPDSIRSPDGVPVNAVRGLLDMTARLIIDRRPSRLVACWDDDWRPAFRVAAIPSYKAHRVVAGTMDTEETPDLLSPQVPVIVAVLAALGIARVGAPGFEADDVIGTLVAHEAAVAVARSARGPTPGRPGVEIVTGDRDLFQLVDDDAGVRVLYTSRGVSDLDVVDQARLYDKYGVSTGRAYADLAVLRGDPSDGLPGVRGIGAKTAVALLRRYGDLAGLLAARDTSDRGLTVTLRARLTDAAEYLAVAPGVVRVAPDAPVGEFDDALPATPADPDALVALAERWGLASSIARLVRAMTGEPSATPGGRPWRR